MAPGSVRRISPIRRAARSVMVISVVIACVAIGFP
jgi:hypothetical protein